MKNLWVNLLVVLLLTALAMTCASAEADEEIILGDGSDLEVQVETADDGIVIDDDLSLEVSELPVLEGNDGIALDLSLEDMEATSVSPSNVMDSNDETGDFEIINGILVKYKGEGGDVVIPDGVTMIGEKAFYECSSLTSVTIGNRVKSISRETFYGCSSLTSITIPDSVTNIGDNAFSGCPTIMTFHTPCDSATTKWAEQKGYKVVKSDHTPVTDPAVALPALCLA